MFLPNTYGMLSRKNGTNIFAEQIFGSPVKTPCAVVHLQETQVKSPIRADSSASRGNAEELTEMAKILFPRNIVLHVGDKFTILGFSLEVAKIEPRNDVLGKLDHYEVDLSQVIQ